ncbi:MAG: LysR family transcriptional regulator [Pseudomonadota bacterium]
MIDLKDLECLVALTRTRHFARAAQECGLSQPAFSMRIRHLEDNLNVAIVKRGNRFQQLTPEGEKVLAHARDILERTQNLERELKASKGEVTGSLVLGVVPTAVAVAAQLAIRLHQNHAGLRTRIITASSLSIQQGIEDRQFDAGLTYADGVSSDLMHIDPAYDETYVLVAPKAMVPEAQSDITWAKAAELPLSLLEPAMQNRKIIDRVFQDAGAQPRVIFDSNGFNAAIVIAKQGTAATIVPKVLIEELGDEGDITVLDLVEPVVEKKIALVVPRQATKTLMLNELREAVRQGL